MYKTVLVDTDIEDGRQVVTALESSGLEIAAAFWFHSEERNDWELIVVSPDVARKGSTEVYRKLQALLKNLNLRPPGPMHTWWDRVKIISPASLTYQRVKHYSGLTPVREGPAQDAYIYKMT